MIYHNTFPASPPSVLPIEEVRVSDHQYGTGGELCLSIRNDNWNPNLTGADMILSTHSLLVLEAPNAEGMVTPAPSDHNYPQTLTIRNSFARFYLSASAQVAICSDDLDNRPITIGFYTRAGINIVAHLFEWSNGEEIKKNTDTPSDIRKIFYLMKGKYYKTNASEQTVASVKTVKDLSALVGTRFSFDSCKEWACIVCNSSLEPTLFTHFRDSDDVFAHSTILAPREGRRSGDEHEDLAKSRVGIVGLGSLGSKIAVSLTRSGVGRLELVDGDVLHVGNLERHAGDWRDVGRHKSDLTAYRLRMISPFVKVEPWRTAIGAQVSAQEAANVNAALAACDLLIDATADPDVFNQLAYLAMQSNRALVWGAVFAGGLGGEIARSRFRKDPSPFDIRQAMIQAYEKSDDAPPLASGREYDGQGVHGSVLIATDACVSTIAGHMTALALDTLLDTEPSPYEHSAYLIGMKRGWLFSAPFDTQPLDVEAPLREPLTPHDDSNIDSDFLESLLTKLAHEAQDKRDND